MKGIGFLHLENFEMVFIPYINKINRTKTKENIKQKETKKKRNKRKNVQSSHGDGNPGVKSVHILALR